MPAAQRAKPTKEANKSEAEDRGLLSKMVSGLGKFFSKKERPDGYPEEREVAQEITQLAETKKPVSQTGPAARPEPVRDPMPEPLPLARPTPEPVIPVVVGEISSASGSPHPTTSNNPFEPPRVTEERPRTPLPVASALPREAAPKQNSSDEFSRRIDINSLPRRTRKEIIGRKAAPQLARNEAPPRRIVDPNTGTDSVLSSVKKIFTQKVEKPTPRSRPSSDAKVTEIARLSDGTPEARRAQAEVAGPQGGDTPTVRRVPSNAPLSKLRQPLKNVLLTLGDSIATGQPQLPRGIAEPDACVRKKLGKVSFCIVPVDWPRQIEHAFQVNTSFYQGSRAIARYDKSKSSHFHAMFNSGDFDDVMAFLRARFGQPTDVWKRIIAPFDRPRQPNPTYVWRSKDTQQDRVTILEIRKFDDTRDVFPDMNHGAIRLYEAGGPPVFPIITALDIMNIDWTARSDHLDNTSPISANSLRLRP
jgi:hypothetical protein